MNATAPGAGTSGFGLSPHAWVALHGDKLHLALEIADEAARIHVELYAPRVPLLSAKHYDSGRVAPMWRGYADKAVIYLESRGLIERDAERPQVVRVLDAPKVAK